jgi:succinyl-CoA synthetase beta subunit
LSIHQQTQIQLLFNTCSELGGGIWVVKAQVHAGGRGKGGGVILCYDVEAVENACNTLYLSQIETDANEFCKVL